MDTTIRILLIEDDPALWDSFSDALSDAGYDVRPSEELATNRRIHAPDLLVLDLDLQSGSSWNLYADWKARFPDLPTVAVTGVPNRFGVARAVGINALMEKPVEPSLLVFVVSSVLNECEKAEARAASGNGFDFRYLTCDDTRYWRGLRGRTAFARRCRNVPRSN